MQTAPRRDRDLKPKRVAIVATARRSLTMLNAILRDGEPWRPEPTHA